MALTTAHSFTMTTRRVAASNKDVSMVRPLRQVWIGRALSTLAVLFLAFDAGIKVLHASPAVQGTTQLGFPESAVLTIGLIELVLLLVYVVPRTAPLGAVLWTGYLGGAVASHFRIGSPLVGFILFPIYVAALIWGGLWLRDARVRALVARAASPSSAR